MSPREVPLTQGPPPDRLVEEQSDVIDGALPDGCDAIVGIVAV